MDQCYRERRDPFLRWRGEEDAMQQHWTNLSGGGQQVDGGQKHPAATRLLTLVHLQELDDGSAGRLWNQTKQNTIHTYISKWNMTVDCPRMQR